MEVPLIAYASFLEVQGISLQRLHGHASEEDYRIGYKQLPLDGWL